MFPYDSITSGVLPPFTPELQRYAERVWERWQLRVIYAEFEIAQVYFYSELYIDLKNGSNAKASKLLDAVQRNNSGVWLNSVKRLDVYKRQVLAKGVELLNIFLLVLHILDLNKFRI